MNTADSSLNVGYNVRLAGAGVVQAQKATDSSVLATTSDQLDSIAFGYVPGSGDYTDQKSFTLTNYGASAATYHLSVAGNGNQRGASVTVSPADVTVPAGQSMTVDANLSIPASAFAALPSDDTFTIGLGGVLTVRGDIVATPDVSDTPDDQTLTVPYLVVPRGLSNVVAGTPTGWTKTKASSTPASTFASTLPVSNDGIHDGTADLYAWGIHSPMETGAPTDIRDVGVQVQPGANFGAPDSDRGLVFLINTYGQSTNQAMNEYDINIDTNGDGQPDYVVFGFDIGALTAGDFNGQYASWILNVSTGQIVDSWLADVPMNGSTIELPLLASDIGLSGSSTFTYSADSFPVGSATPFTPGGPVDTTGSASFNPYNSAVSTGDGSLPGVAADGGTASLPLVVNRGLQQSTHALGWLLASVDDASGAAQAEEIPGPQNMK
jgi:hypothetical protein